MTGRRRLGRYESAAAAAAAVTAAAAAGLHEILGAWHPAILDGRADVFADLLLEPFQFALGGEEITGDLVLEKGIAGTFKFADFRSTQLDAGVLLLVKFLAALMDALILEAGGIVVEETLDVGLELEKCGILGDLGAKFLGFGDHGGVFSD